MTRPALTTVLFALSTVALIGCGSSSSSGTKPSKQLGTVPSATASGAVGTLPATDSTDSSAGTSGTSGASACGDVVAKVSAEVSSSVVTKVEVMGGCSLLNIATSLANDGISTALDICDAATAVAYIDTVKGVSVVGSSGKELAVGVKGSPCIGEP